MFSKEQEENPQELQSKHASSFTGDIVGTWKDSTDYPSFLAKFQGTWYSCHGQIYN